MTKKKIIFFSKSERISADHIFASTVILSDEFPKLFNKIDNISVQKLNIYEPIQHMPNKNNNAKDKIQNRKIVGSMIAQFALLEKFNRQDFEKNNQNCKDNNFVDSSRIDTILKKDNMIFQDLIFN